MMEREHPSVMHVPKTGQTGCWDTQGREIPPGGTGMDGEYQYGREFSGRRFEDNGDGTVTDRLTRLVWLKDADPFRELTWDEALGRTRALASGSSGLSDQSTSGMWRMPNIRELLSLIDYGRYEPILPPGHPFDNVKNAIYWTSTSLAPAARMAWMMTLGIGPTVFDIKTSLNRTWPVRGDNSLVPRTGQAACFDSSGNPTSAAGTGQDGEIQAGSPPLANRFQDNNNGTITDRATDLVWLADGNPFGFRVWADALALCNTLRSGMAGLTDSSKAGDWRLPNVREIESLVDYGQAGPSLPQGNPFKNVRPSSYWTSTSVAAAPTEAMFIILGVGPSIFDSKEQPFFVWPVRNRLSHE